MCINKCREACSSRSTCHVAHVNHIYMFLWCIQSQTKAKAEADKSKAQAKIDAHVTDSAQNKENLKVLQVSECLIILCPSSFTFLLGRPSNTAVCQLTKTGHSGR